MKALRGANAPAVLKRLNPIIRGWSAYYRTVVSSQLFARLDNYMWVLTYKWAKYTGTSRRAGLSPGTSASSTVPAQPVGLWRPQ